MPGPHCSSFHLGFGPEGASVLSVLAYFNLLHLFSEGGTVISPIFTDRYSNLLGVYSHVPVAQKA